MYVEIYMHYLSHSEHENVFFLPCEHHTVVSQFVTLIVMAKGRKTPASSGEKVMMKHPKPVFIKVSAQVRYHFCYNAQQMS